MVLQQNTSDLLRTLETEALQTNELKVKVKLFISLQKVKKKNKTNQKK